MKKLKMNTKNILVSFLTIVSILFLVATVSAISTMSIDDVRISVDDIVVQPGSNTVSVISGDTIEIVVKFTADGVENDYLSEVTVKAELDGEIDETSKFDVEEGNRYTKTLRLNVPYDFDKDEPSKNMDLEITIEGEDGEGIEVEYEKEILLNVQRPSYVIDIKSLNVANTIEAGETFPVDFVLKNTGYNNLDDTYVTVSIAELGVSKTSYLGDLITEWEDEYNDDDDETDTISGRLELKIPYDVEAGIYEVKVTVSNDDATSSESKEVVIKNDFANNVIVTGIKKSVAVGENSEYSLLIVNPTEKLKVYRVITESSGSISSNTNEAVVAVEAGSSKTVTITANAISEGEHTFDVTVLSGEQISRIVTFGLNAEGKSVTNNPITVLTVILAIVFLVLLVVLIVLITKKPEKSEEFGESYY